MYSLIVFANIPPEHAHFTCLHESSSLARGRIGALSLFLFRGNLKLGLSKCQGYAKASKRKSLNFCNIPKEANRWMDGCACLHSHTPKPVRVVLRSMDPCQGYRALCSFPEIGLECRIPRNILISYYSTLSIQPLSCGLDLNEHCCDSHSFIQSFDERLLV